MNTPFVQSIHAALKADEREQRVIAEFVGCRDADQRTRLLAELPLIKETRKKAVQDAAHLGGVTYDEMNATINQVLLERQKAMEDA
jgi:hypothetical protein